MGETRHGLIEVETNQKPGGSILPNLELQNHGIPKRHLQTYWVPGDVTSGLPWGLGKGLLSATQALAQKDPWPLASRDKASYTVLHVSYCWLHFMVPPVESSASPSSRHGPFLQ